MILKPSGKLIQQGEDIIGTVVFGPEENPAFYDAARSILLEEYNLITMSDVLENIPREKGQLPDSDYDKKPISGIHIAGCDSAGKIQMVYIRPLGVARHTHEQGEIFFIPHNNIEGILTMEQDVNPLIEGGFYNPPIEMTHSLNPIKPKPGEELQVLVLQFTREMMEGFREGYQINRYEISGR